MPLFGSSESPTSMIYCLLCAQRREDRSTVSFTDCNHTFCETCLLEHHLKQLACASTGTISRNYKLENYTVRCPNCKNPRPTEGIELTSEIPHSHKVRDLLYKTKISKAAKDAPSCDICAAEATKFRRRDARKQCVTCRKKMCEQCFEQHKKEFVLSTGSQEALKHVAMRINQHEVKLKCEKHAKSVGYYCTQCRCLVCEKCMSDRKAHLDHPIQVFRDIAQKHCTSANDLQQTIHKILEEKTQRKVYIAQLMKRQQDAIHRAKKDIERNTEWLRKSVEEASESLMKTLDKITNNLRTLHDNHTQYLDYTMHHLSRLQHFIQEMCQPGLEPAILLHGVELKQHIQNYATDTKILGKEKQAMETFQRTVKFELNVDLQNAKITKIGDLSHEWIQIDDVPTPRFATPLPKASIYYQTELERKGPSPGGLLFTSNGSLLVTDYSHGEIVKYVIPKKEREAEVIRDSQPLKFFPHKMDSDPHRKVLYVTDDNQKCVKAFKPSGECTMTSMHRFSSPSGVALSVDGSYLVVSDILAHNITILKASSLKKDFQFGRKGQFNVPEFVMVDDENRIFVSDRENNQVSIWTMAGKFVDKFGSKGSGPGEFNNPMGLCKDEFGNILVVDSNNYRICRFNASGEYIDTVLTFQRGEAIPYGIAISRTGDIAVSDKTSAIVRVYHVYNYH